MGIDLPSIRSVLDSGHMFCTVADALLRAKYGEPAYLWDPTTLWLEIRDDFGLETTADVSDKMGAVQVLMTGDGFYKRVDAFLAVANTMAGGSPGFQMMQPLEPDEAVWAIVEAALMRDSLTFSPSVEEFLHVLFQGLDPHPIVSYALASNEVDSAEIVRMARESATDPQDDTDAHIASQLHDLTAQLSETGLAGQVENL